MSDKPEKVAVDWEALEPHYRSGIRSLKELGKEFGCSDAAIVKHAKRNGWERDLSAKIKAKAGVPVDRVDEALRPGFVYIIFIESGGRRFHKIGMAENLQARLKAHQCSSPFDIRVAVAYFVESMRQEERMLHRMFEGKRVRGEWFTLDDADLRVVAERSLRA